MAAINWTIHLAQSVRRRKYQRCVDMAADKQGGCRHYVFYLLAESRGPPPHTVPRAALERRVPQQEGNVFIGPITSGSNHCPGFMVP